MDFLGNTTTYISKFSLTDGLDIICVTVALFFLLRLIRGTRAVQLIKGVAAVAVILVITSKLELKTLNWLMVSILNYWVIALIILFQPELRLIIERIGRGQLFQESFLPNNNNTINLQMINILTDTARRLAEHKVGALIAIERQVGLSDIINTGQIINGEVSYELLETIFHPGTAMHDGGMVIRDGKVAAAMCLFPLTSKEQQNSAYGTRHRAGIGLSEITDAIIIIVSEETGKISVVLNGVIENDITAANLKEYLLSIIQPNSSPITLKRIFSNTKNKEKGENK